VISREEILSRFEHWLDGALASEAPPAGIDSEILAAVTANPAEETDGAGAYAMWSAITALTQEVKLQGRAFKELNTTLGDRTGRALDDLRTEFGERERILQRQAEYRCRKEILHALLDLRDRLERGLDSAISSAAQTRHRSRLLRFLGPEPDRGAFRIRVRVSSPRLQRLLRPEPDDSSGAVQALIKGYELGLDRLDQTLADINVRRIRTLGERFDPRSMNAVDKRPSATVAEGIVLEVYRSGFEWNGEVFRPAQVQVSAGASPRPVAASESAEFTDHE
jgi:molecular chaperone GrpE (heat shock protein)